MKIKAVIIGTISTLALTIGGSLIAFEISTSGLPSWLNNQPNGIFNELGSFNEELVEEYYNSLNVVALSVLLTTLGFGLGGYISGYLAKNKEILVALTSCVLALIFNFSYFIPLFVIAAVFGSLISIKVKRANKSLNQIGANSAPPG